MITSPKNRHCLKITSSTLIRAIRYNQDLEWLKRKREIIISGKDIDLICVRYLRMKEFDYELDYKRLDFTDPSTRQLYRIGRGRTRGFIGIFPYTDDICAHWKFRTLV